MSRLLTAALIFMAGVSMAWAGTLYSTEFESFPAGDNLWAGTEGWLSSQPAGGVQGIIQDPVQDLPLGKAGFLGYTLPSSAFTTIYRSFNHDPVASGQPRVVLESLLGIQDSTNGRRDRFHVTFYNSSGDFLAALTFDNTTGKVLCDNGVSVQETGVSFVRGNTLLGLAALQILRIEIHLDLNRWSASLDGIPLLDKPFTATGKTLTFGSLAFEWEIPSGTPANAGNNWLLVADLLVASIPPDPFSILSITRDSSGAETIKWPGHPAFDYQILYSADLVSWKNDLPASTIVANAISGPLSFTDPEAASQTRRFYRVARSPTP